VWVFGVTVVVQLGQHGHVAGSRDVRQSVAVQQLCVFVCQSAGEVASRIGGTLVLAGVSTVTDWLAG
jgi:hypothetical protein